MRTRTPTAGRGKRLDTGSGTYDMGARRYSAESGRFLQYDLYYDSLDNLGLSEDPLSQNRYAFAGGNPVNFVEVDGHRVVDEAGALPLAWILGRAAVHPPPASRKPVE